MKETTHLIDLNEIIKFFISLKKKTQFIILIIPFFFSIIAYNTHGLIIKNYETIFSLKKFSMRGYEFNNIFNELLKAEETVTAEAFVDYFYNDIINVYKSTPIYETYLENYKNKNFNLISPPKVYADSAILKIKFIYSKNIKQFDQFGNEFILELLDKSADRLFESTIKRLNVINKDLEKRIQRHKSHFLLTKQNNQTENATSDIQTLMFENLNKHDRINFLIKNIETYKGFKDIYRGNYLASHSYIETRIIGLPRNQYIFLSFLVGIVLSSIIIIILKSSKKKK